MESNNQEMSAVQAFAAPTVFSIPMRHVEALLLFAAKSDIRKYLCGINFANRAGNIRACATDGHSLLLAKCEAIGPELSVIVPRDLLESAVKSMSKKERTSATLEIGASFDAQTSLYVVTVKTDRGGSFVGSAIDGRFPEWHQVFPKESFEESPAVISGYLIERFDSAATLWNYGKARFCVYGQRKDSACLVSIGFDDEVIGLVMPRREDNRPTTVPSWAFD